MHILLEDDYEGLFCYICGDGFGELLMCDGSGVGGEKGEDVAVCDFVVHATCENIDVSAGDFPPCRCDFVILQTTSAPLSSLRIVGILLIIYEYIYVYIYLWAHARSSFLLPYLCCCDNVATTKSHGEELHRMRESNSSEKS